MAAMLPWSYFSQSVNRAAFSLVENRNVISKVYFPRMVIPLAAVFSGLIDFAASFIVFIALMAIYRMPLRLEMLWLPLFLAVAVAFALAVGLWMATLAARFHDVQYAINFLIMILMYASPVIYSVSLVPEQLKWLYTLNPMTGVIEGFRWACLGSSDPPGTWFLVGILVILVGLVSGAYFFRRTERTIVDVI